MAERHMWDIPFGLVVGLSGNVQGFLLEDPRVFAVHCSCQRRWHQQRSPDEGQATKHIKSQCSEGRMWPCGSLTEVKVAPTRAAPSAHTSLLGVTSAAYASPSANCSNDQIGCGCPARSRCCATRQVGG